MRIFIKVFLLIFYLSQSAFAATELVFSVLSLDQATKQVIDNNKVKVLGAKTEFIGEKEVHVIKVLTKDGRIQYIKVDANTGRIIR